MKWTVPGRAFFVPVYLVLTILFLVVHFTRVEAFSASVGGIVVRGRSSVGTALSPPQIRRIRISAGGFDLSFRKGDGAVLVTDDGIRHPLRVTGWEKSGETIRVLFSDGTGITFTASPHDSDIVLRPEVPDTVPPVRSLELPLRAGTGTQVSRDADRPDILGVSDGDKDYSVTLPRDSSWNPDRRRLNLVVLDRAEPVLRISEDIRGGGLNAVEWFAGGTVPSEEVYQTRIEGWTAVVRNGWKSRFDTRLGLWTDENGRSGWNDVRASAVLADSVALNELASQIQSVVAVADRAPKDIGWLPSPYLGNIINQSRSHRDELEQSARTAVAALGTGDSLFRSELSLTALVDSGFAAEAGKIVALARQEPAAETANSEVLNRIRVLQEARELGLGDNGPDSTRRLNLVEKHLLGDILWVRDGLWLVDDEGAIDVRQSVDCGLLLMKEAIWNNSSMYQGIGRQMVLSSLAYADNAGILPGRLLFEGSGEVVREGKIAPETLFAEIINPPAYPRHVSLARELGSGSWAITAAEKFTLRSTPRETTVTMDFPPGAIHHVAIKGVKKFTVLYMNGIRWNGDPNFQRYYAGWSYDEGAETLFVKIRHRGRTETLRILYYEPEPDAAPAPTPAPAAEAG